MRTTLAAALALLWVAASASAHRLDEYLQASMISIEKDRVEVGIRLTPGVQVCPRVLADIDTNSDGIISAPEQAAYAQRVLRDLSLAIDGKPLQPRLVSSTFAKIDDMKEGLGEIVLAFDAQLPAGPSDRRLTFENHHQRPMAAYLANCLFPSEPDIRIMAQSRSDDQSVYQLDYTQASRHPTANASASSATIRVWLGADAIVLLVGLAYLGRRRATAKVYGDSSANQ
jgi:hypothetical protein